MVGLIHKILFDVIESTAKLDAVLDVKRRAGVPVTKEFRMDEAYDDDEWQRLFQATCDVLGLTFEQTEVIYADFFCRDALKRWPTWFEMSANARGLLERQPRIHNGFATGVRNPEARRAINDKFQLETTDEENGRAASMA